MVLGVVFGADRRRCAGFSEAIFAHEAFDIARGVAGDVAIDVGVDFVGVTGLIGVVAMHVIAEKDSFGAADVGGEAVGAFATAEIEKKDSGFEAFVGVVSDCF